MKDQQQFIVISGLPGTGKTTLAKALARAIQATHMNTDMIREELGKKGQYDPATKTFIYEALQRRVAETLQLERTIVIDATFYQDEFRTPFFDLARQHQVPLRWVELEAPPEVIQKRVSNKRAQSEADFSVYQKIKAAYEPLSIPHLVLSSAENNVDQLVKKSLDHIRALNK